MADISKCANEDCTLKEKCYRYKVKSDEIWQTYGGFTQDEDGECEYHWETVEARNERESKSNKKK